MEIVYHGQGKAMVLASIMLMDNSKEGLQETTELLRQYIGYVGLKINAGNTRHNARLPVKELRRRRIAEKAPWISTLKVTQSNKSATSPIWMPSSVRMDQLTENCHFGFRKHRVLSTSV
jgi:hypothetical protein